MSNLAASSRPRKREPVAPARDAGPLLVRLRPPPQARGLAADVADQIAAEIRAGRLAQGTRLPTEAALMASTGVSRTVIREAVSALKAEGLVVTRQGSGAFVAADLGRRPFRIDADGLHSLQDVLDVMELRIAVEIGSAGLAAERGHRRSLGAIEQALSRMERAIAGGEPAVDQDFAFHRSIAQACGNPQFVRFLEMLGSIVIPRQSIRIVDRSPDAQRRYLTAVQREHRRIVDAIAARDPVAARQAMRTHLARGLARYTALAGRGPGRRKEPE
jgi:GntR family transcriptional repressor for pyruvate dehydrogenase complex